MAVAVVLVIQMKTRETRGCRWEVVLYRSPITFCWHF